MGNILGYALSSTKQQENYIELNRAMLPSEDTLIKAMDQYSQQLSTMQPASSICFYLLSKAYIINMLDKAQLTSYRQYSSLDIDQLHLLELVCKAPCSDTDAFPQVNHLIDPLKESFQSNDINNVFRSIQVMKNIKETPLTTSDYRLLDILEYMAKMCSTTTKNQPFDYWLTVLDMLFRGSNVKLSRRASRFTVNKISETIIFQCLCQDTTSSQQKPVEIAFCCQTKDKMTESHNILINKSILSHLQNNYDKDIYVIGLQLTENKGCLYSLKSYKSLFIASFLYHISIPNTVHEFQSFLYEQQGLEILCHLKKHCTNMAKILRQTALDKMVL